MSMLDLQIILKNKIMLSAVFCSFLTIAIVSYTVFSWVGIDDKTKDLQDIYQIRDAVNTANQAIKSAAIAPDMKTKTIELARRFETRKQADNAIHSFDKRKHNTKITILFEQMETKRNGSYRSSQDDVVLLIESGAQDVIVWRAMVDYQIHQGVYMEYLNSISGLITDELNSGYKMMLRIIIGFILVLVLCANFIVSHAYKFHEGECL